MSHLFHTLLILIIQALAVRRDAHVRFLNLQLEIMKRKIPGNRVVIDPNDRTRLLTLGAELDHDVKDSLKLVTHKTYKRWLLEKKQGKEAQKVGRPKLAKDLYDLVVRMAKENVGWGINRILGEIKKLGNQIGRTSIRRVLKKEGLYPDPHRRAHRVPDSPWRKFLDLHLNTIVACDFLCKAVWTPLGKKTAYFLMFIHLESRKVFLSPATYEPDEAWVCQQARNVSIWLDDSGVKQRFILHDRDTKFSAAFDAVFEGQGVEVVKTPYEAPDANAFAESWIGNFKRECLNHFFCISVAHADHIAQSFVKFYNQYRPHQSKGNRPLRFCHDPLPANSPATGPIRCQQELNGLLKHYYRQAA